MLDVMQIKWKNVVSIHDVRTGTFLVHTVRFPTSPPVNTYCLGNVLLTKWVMLR
jgi:hypothetical protein